VNGEFPPQVERGVSSRNPHAQHPCFSPPKGNPQRTRHTRMRAAHAKGTDRDPSSRRTSWSDLPNLLSSQCL